MERIIAFFGLAAAGSANSVLCALIMFPPRMCFGELKTPHHAATSWSRGHYLLYQAPDARVCEAPHIVEDISI
jgi:hypothetical protein